MQAERISLDAYQALRDALSTIFWFRSSFRRYVRTALRGAPEVLAEVDWDAAKRDTADVVVDALMEKEARYRVVILDLMLAVANRTDFSEIDAQEDPKWGRKGREAVASLKAEVLQYEEHFQQQRRMEAEQRDHRVRLASQRRFSDELASLRADFDELGREKDTHRRGKAFEPFLNRLFNLHDLDPRAAYSLKFEQIDGAFSFDTDDYILEARWRQQPVSREQADAFDKKVRRKGRNALGLMVSVNGFSSAAIGEYSTETTFITIDGADLMAILTGGYRLEDVLRRKKRHMNEEGACYFPVREF